MKQPDEDAKLLYRASDGDGEALNELMQKHRGRLKRLVRLRLNPLLQGRVDDSDIIQDAYLEVSKRLVAYAQSPEAPFFLWIRQIVNQKLIDIHRIHLDAECRSVSRELSLNHSPFPAANSTCLADQLLGKSQSPADELLRDENRTILEDQLNRMDDKDREVLALRHFEQLSNLEVASVLGIETSTASKRYVRALSRLRDQLMSNSNFTATELFRNL